LEVASLAHDADELAQASRVRDLGARVSVARVPWLRNSMRAAVALGGTQPLTHVMLDASDLASSLARIVFERPPDVVLAYCSGMARFAVQPPLSAFPLVLDLVDVDSAKWAALAASASWPKRWVFAREARCLAPFEREAAASAYATIVVNDRERDALRELAPTASVLVLPNGVDAAHLHAQSPPVEEPRVVFCGVMNYAPNVEGVLWFARTVWPLVRAKRPDAAFAIVGSHPTAAVRRLASDELGIAVTGTVSDVRRYLWSAAVAVTPLMTARGVQNKVLEAVAAGLPTVTTSPVFRGLPGDVRLACRVADAPEEFAHETLSLLSLMPAERRAIAQRADLTALTWDTQLSPLHALLTEAAGSRAGSHARSPL